jgi:RNA recognition motif-containing protein
MAWAEMG